MDGENTRKSRIQIPLPSKPRPYRPGDGPPLAPLRLEPEWDSTAYIIDKRVLPGTARDGELQLQMYYVVGWWDVPAARVTILATKILDYVSPGELESFEYKKLLERDAEIEEEEALKKEKLEMAKQKKAVKPTSAISTPTTPGTPVSISQKRRGRPSKAELQARKLSKQASVTISESIEVTIPHTSTSGPSLSTPQKKRAREMVTDVEEVDDPDPDDAIHRQLCGENDEDEDEDDDDDLEDEDMEVEEAPESRGTISLDRVPGTVSSGPQISSYARNSSLNQDSSTLIKSANANLVLKSSTSHVPVPKVLRSNKQPWELPAITPLPPPIPKPRPPLPANNKPRRIPPLPPGRKQSTTPVPVPTPVKSDKKIPLQYPQFYSQARVEPPPAKPKSNEPKQSTTPVPIPQYPRLKNVKNIKSEKCEPSSSAPPLPPPPPTQPLKTSPQRPQHHGFTPAGRSSGRWPSETPQSSSEVAADSPLSDHFSSTRMKKRTPKPKPKHAAGNGQVWVVSRLEGDKLVQSHGRRTRYFKVRWEGDWPPDQNPTWEPEINIAPELVAAYFNGKAKGAAGRRRTTSSSAHRFDSSNFVLRPEPLTLKRKYSNVAEAFAGDADDLDELRNSADSGGEADSTVYGSGSRGKRREVIRHNYYGDDEGEDEILVVATEQDPRTKRREPKPGEKMDQLGAAFMRDLAAAIHRRSGDQNGS
ncbi:hypothetical protein F5B19DRAFT_498368 [Rostrohypoxylon terebratum]|nr:hypothetical protein F5B19DRAFT_498368 [Rostrohypoxylon terebratum]